MKSKTCKVTLDRYYVVQMIEKSGNDLKYHTKSRWGGPKHGWAGYVEACEQPRWRNRSRRAFHTRCSASRFER